MNNPNIAFAPALALPFRSNASRRCVITRRIPVAMRIVGDPERSKDDAREDEGEPPLVGGVVPPADFQENDFKPSIDISPEVAGVAGIAKDDDLLSEEKPLINGRQADVISTADNSQSGRKKKFQVGRKPKIAGAAKVVKTTEIEDDIPEPVSSDTESEESEKKDSEGLKTSLEISPEQMDKAKATPEPVSSDTESEDSGKKDSEGMKTSMKISPEQIEKAKATRAAAVKAAEERDAKKAERGKEILAKAENVLFKIGTNSKAFELGEIARSKAEVFVENTISEGAKKEAPQQEKLKGSAASAAKSLVAAITKGWEETVAPRIRDILPSEYREVSNKALASAAVGLFVAVAFLPSLFSGGEQKPKQVEKKKIDAETAMLEKKLQRDRSTVSSYSSKSASQKAVFPPDEVDTVTAPRKSKLAPSEMKTVTPAEKVSEAPKEAPSPQAPPSLPQTSLSTSPKLEEAAPPTAPPAATTPAPPKLVEPTKPKETEPPKPVEVTPAIVMSSVSKALGPDANLVSSASFDTLAPQPTIVLEVAKKYHTMPVNEQKKLAQVMLQSARGLGYERVSLVEIGTGVEVAHAGIGVNLEDEAENLRAQVGSLRALSDKLAMQNASKEAEIGALNRRISEEREESALQKVELEKSIKTLRAENSGLLDDLADAKAEIARMPDRLALEERTIEAERKSDKMSDTVEMLSAQLSKARNEEALAKKSQAESIEAASQAAKEKNEALASVGGQIERAQKAAEDRANELIATVEREAQTSVDEANKQVREVEERLTRTVEESKESMDQTRNSYEKQLSDQKENNDKEVQTIQSKYESMLEDVQKRAQADLDAFQKEADRKMSAAMKEAKAFANSLTKERDDALKAVQKTEKQTQKAADKAEREKQGLQKRIERLEAKLSKKTPVQEEQPAEVVSPSSR